MSRLLEGYREGRTIETRIGGPSVLGFINSLVGIRTVYIIVFIVAVIMLIQTMKRDEDHPRSSSVSDDDSSEHRSGEKED